MRGKALVAFDDGAIVRITPAYAGKRLAKATNANGIKDHPRICGEKRFGSSVAFRIMGSPPHMRGKGLCHPPSARGAGITPAYAGKSPLLQQCFWL